MNRLTWSPEERDEYEALCERAWSAGTSTRGRAEAYLALIDDAAQAHRLFARDAERDLRTRGASAQLNAWRKRQQMVAVAYDGRILTKPRTIGTTRTDAAGERYATQSLFDLMTWEEIERKVAEYIKQVGAYRGNIALCLRLLELREAAPGAANPAAAVCQLETSIEAWLGEAA